MKTKKRMILTLAGVGSMTLVAAGVYASVRAQSQSSTGSDRPAPAIAAVETSAKVRAPTAAAAQGGIKVSFKLDPRLTQGLYMGERWVSPASYQTGLDAVEARAHFLDGRGRSADVSATWTPAAPDMLSLSSRQGHRVKISVLREGQSDVTVKYGEASRTLTVKAVRQAGTWRVDIVQS